MKRSSDKVLTISLILSMLLTTCDGSVPSRSLNEMAQPVRAEEPVVSGTGPAMATLPSEVTATAFDSTATLEPTFTDEPGVTEEATATREPGITEEATTTDIPTEENQSYPSEPTATEEPAEGFWLNSDSSGHFVAVVPREWIHSTTYNHKELVQEEDTEEAILTRDTLTSPDSAAYIHFMEFDDYGKTNWDQSLARERALLILNEIYSAGRRDVLVMDVRLMPDDSEQITWASRTCKCTGVIAFKPLKTVTTTNLYLFAISYQNSAKDLYSDILNYVLGTLDFSDE